MCEKNNATTRYGLQIQVEVPAYHSLITFCFLEAISSLNLVITTSVNS